jgi:hypothetical protein
MKLMGNVSTTHAMNVSDARGRGYDDPYAGRSRSLGGDYGSGDESSGRFGELAHYDHISLRDIAVETVTDRTLSDAPEDIRRGHLSGK